MACNTFTHEFTGEQWKGKTSIKVGSYINGEWVKGSSGKMVELVFPSIASQVEFES